MVYLSQFKLRSGDSEQGFFAGFTRTCYDSYYPFQFFPTVKELTEVEFSDITIFSGSNGSGKSTLLNIIAEKLKLTRRTPFNKTDFFDPYLKDCSYTLTVFDKERIRDLMKVSCIITSDDVFNHILIVRERNERLSFKRELIFEEKSEMVRNGWSGPRGFNTDDPGSIDRYQDYYAKFSQNGSKYVRRNLGVDERTYSNGENGFKFFTDIIQPGGIYLLDEPENSLSPEMQSELAKYIMEMARFYDCQFIISSHSPFFLSIPYAHIYNMDAVPVISCKWTELPNIRIYYDFFTSHSEDFE